MKHDLTREFRSIRFSTLSRLLSALFKIDRFSLLLLLEWEMEKARQCLELNQEESDSVARLAIHPYRVGATEFSFYEDFALRGIRVDRVEPGLVSCTFKVPPRLTVSSTVNQDH